MSQDHNKLFELNGNALDALALLADLLQQDSFFGPRLVPSPKHGSHYRGMPSIDNNFDAHATLITLKIGVEMEDIRRPGYKIHLIQRAEIRGIEGERRTVPEMKCVKLASRDNNQEAVWLTPQEAFDEIVKRIIMKPGWENYGWRSSGKKPPEVHL